MRKQCSGEAIPIWRSSCSTSIAALATSRNRASTSGLTTHSHESGLDPHGLTIEITETVLLDATASDLADLRDLKERGVGLALDDFGTGYASLRYLAELPITCIKIDRSFTSRLPADPTAMTLVRATVGLAEQLAISCVVEGVETDEQRDALPGL